MHIYEFAFAQPSIFGIAVCNQNSHSRPGKTRDCDFLAGRDCMSAHRILIRIPERNERSVDPSYCDAVAIVACLKWRNFAFRSRIYSKLGEPPGAIFCDFISIELASFVDIITHRFQDLIRIFDEFERFSVVSQSLLYFVEITFKPEICVLVQQK